VLFSDFSKALPAVRSIDGGGNDDDDDDDHNHNNNNNNNGSLATLSITHYLS